MIVTGGGGVHGRYEAVDDVSGELLERVPLGRAASRTCPNLTPIGHMCGTLDVLRNKAYHALGKYSDRPLSSALTFPISPRPKRRSPNGRRRQPPSTDVPNQATSTWKEDNTSSFWKDSAYGSYAYGEQSPVWGASEDRIYAMDSPKSPHRQQRGSGATRKSVQEFAVPEEEQPSPQLSQKTPPRSVSRRRSSADSTEKAPRKQKTNEMAGASDQPKATEDKEDNEPKVHRGKNILDSPRKDKPRKLTLEELILTRNGEIQMADEEDSEWAQDEDDKAANNRQVNPSDLDLFNLFQNSNSSKANDQKRGSQDLEQLSIQPGDDKREAKNAVQQKIERARRSLVVAEQDFERKKVEKRASLEHLEGDIDIEKGRMESLRQDVDTRSPLEQLARRMSHRV